MPIPGISNPTTTFTGPYNSARNPILNGYLFDATLNMPEVSDVVIEKFKDKYKMTTLLARLGAYDAVPNDVFSWYVQDRQRSSATVSSGVTGLPAASLTLTLDTVASGANLGYYIVGDTIRTESGKILIVTAVSAAGGFQTITVAKPDGTNIVTGDIANTETIGHIGTAFEEGSTGPNGRLFLPSETYNYTQIFRRGIKVTGSALTQKSWVNGGEAWYWTDEDYMFDEFYYDQELHLMFGTRSVNGTRKTSQGIWDRTVTAAEGKVVNFASGTGIAETDLQNIITQLNREAGSNELLCLCGSEAIADIQIALRPYNINGSMDYGKFGNNLVGLDTWSYKFAGKTIHFMHYPLFDDPKALPFISTPTATKVNFRHVALFLDMGNVYGQPNIGLKYRAHEGENRKFIHQVIPGMHGSGETGTAANSFDGMEVQIMSEIGYCIKTPWLNAALVPTS